jgi:hypothetical protein
MQVNGSIVVRARDCPSGPRLDGSRYGRCSRAAHESKHSILLHLGTTNFQHLTANRLPSSEHQIMQNRTFFGFIRCVLSPGAYERTHQDLCQLKVAHDGYNLLS